jgi:probable rRNA maturation factor
MKPSSPVGGDPSPRGAGATGPEVVGFDRTGDGFDGLDRLVDLARQTLVGEGVGTGRLDLVLVDRGEMAELNAEHLGHEGPTDVLSFPLDADEVMAGLVPGGGPPPHLGDVIICPSVARDQAPTHCGTEDAELALLVIHGVLHVLGHDHGRPDESEAMQARERAHLDRLGHVHPLDAARPAPC